VPPIVIMPEGVDVGAIFSKISRSDTQPAAGSFLAGVLCGTRLSGLNGSQGHQAGRGPILARSKQAGCQIQRFLAPAELETSPPRKVRNHGEEEQQADQSWRVILMAGRAARGLSVRETGDAGRQNVRSPDGNRRRDKPEKMLPVFDPADKIAKSGGNCPPP